MRKLYICYPLLIGIMIARVTYHALKRQEQIIALAYDALVLNV